MSFLQRRDLRNRDDGGLWTGSSLLYITAPTPHVFFKSLPTSVPRVRLSLSSLLCYYKILSLSFSSDDPGPLKATGKDSSEADGGTVLGETS